MSRLLSASLLAVAMVACADGTDGGDGVNAFDPGVARPQRDAGTNQRPARPEAGRDNVGGDGGDSKDDAGLDAAAPPDPDEGAGPECTPQPERCNDRDDDCDGRVDEDFETGGVCSSNENGCVVEGTLGCNADGVFCDIGGWAPGAEVCDGADNDCDGSTDEDFPGQACCTDDFQCGLGESCVDGLCAQDDPGPGPDPDPDPDPGPAPSCAAPFEMVDFGLFQGDASLGEAAHNGECGGFVNPEIVATFVRPDDEVVRIDTAGSLSDTVVYVRTDCLNPASEVACNDNDPDGLLFESVVEFMAVGGQRYFVFIDGGLLGSGPFVLEFGPGAMPDCAIDDDCPGQICRGGRCVDPPAAASCDAVEAMDDFGIYAGDTAGRSDDIDGSCVPEGGSERVYSFELDVAARVVLDTGDSDFDTVLSVRTACADAATEVACDDDGGLGTRSRVELDAEADVTYFVVVEGFRAASGVVALEFSEGAAVNPPDAGVDPPPDDCDADLCAPGRCIADACHVVPAACAGADLAVPFGQFRGNTVGASAFAPSGCGLAGDAGEAVYLFAVEQDVDLTLNTAGSDYDTVLYVLEDCDREVACSDDTGLGLTSSINMRARAGVLYAVVVDGYNNAEGDFVLDISER